MSKGPVFVWVPRLEPRILCLPIRGQSRPSQKQVVSKQLQTTPFLETSGFLRSVKPLVEDLYGGWPFLETDQEVLGVIEVWPKPKSARNGQ